MSIFHRWSSRIRLLVSNVRRTNRFYLKDVVIFSVFIFAFENMQKDGFNVRIGMSHPVSCIKQDSQQGQLVRNMNPSQGSIRAKGNQPREGDHTKWESSDSINKTGGVNPCVTSTSQREPPKACPCLFSFRAFITIKNPSIFDGPHMKFR